MSALDLYLYNTKNDLGNTKLLFSFLFIGYRILTSLTRPDPNHNGVYLQSIRLGPSFHSVNHGLVTSKIEEIAPL